MERALHIAEMLNDERMHMQMAHRVPTLRVIRFPIALSVGEKKLAREITNTPRLLK